MALVAGTLALLALLWSPATAIAHGVLRASEPASGARLTAVPRLLRLTFNEPVELAVARLELLGPDGRPVALSALRRGDSAAVIAADVTGALTAGRYTVAWQIAGRDGHPVRGRFRFAIDSGAAGLGQAPADTAAAAPIAAPSTVAPPVDSPAAPPDSAPAPPAATGFDAESPAYVAIRWLGFVAMLALVGAVGFGRMVVPAAVRRAPTEPAAPEAWSGAASRGAGAVALAGAALLLVVALLRLAAQSVALNGPAWSDPARLGAMLGGTTWGTAWWLLVGAAVVALAGAALARRGSSAGWTVAAVGAVGVAGATALSGHAAGVPRLAPLAIGVDAAHILGAGGWLGTLLVIVAVGIPAALRLPSGPRGRAAAELVHAFSPLALACAALVAVTGGISAWLHLGELGALWGSAYGRTLLLKLALLLPVAALGAYHWRRVRPTLGDEAGARRLRRSAAIELAIGAAVLATTAVLVATPTNVVP
jgi:putative copper export protein/methionine-rich copper-binding protein CopC